MTYNEIIAEVAQNVNMNKKIVDRTYRAYWRAVKEYIASLPLKKSLSEEEFMKLRPNINIPSIGKLYITPGRYKALKEKYNKIKDN